MRRRHHNPDMARSYDDRNRDDDNHFVALPGAVFGQPPRITRPLPRR